MNKIRSLLVVISRAICVIILTGFIAAAIIASRKDDQYFRNRSVKLVNAQGSSCSGQQVRAPNGKDYILTAGHCKPLADIYGRIMVITEDGRRMERKVIKEDRMSDLLLLEGLPNLTGLSVAHSSHRTEHVRTYTHGKGHSVYQTEGELLEEAQIKIVSHVINDDNDLFRCMDPKHSVKEVDVFFFKLTVCFLDVTETFTTAKIVPGSSGGMVVDDSGDLVGIVSAGDGDFGALVTLNDIKVLLDTL